MRSPDVVPEDRSAPPSRSRGRVVAGWSAVAAVGLAGAFWAGSTVARPPATPIGNEPDVRYEVVLGEVGQVQVFTAQATWPVVATLRSAAVGTVTSVDGLGSAVGAGGQILSVDLRPVVVGLGSVPAFRDFQQGVRGADVGQLQAMLRVEGFDAGDSGVVDAATERAVRGWQRQHGFPVDGVVRAGDVVFVPTLPARLATADDVEVGAVLAAGQPLVHVLGPAPEVTITLDAAQRELVPLEAEVTVHAGERAFGGVIASSASTDDGRLVLRLTATDGTPICGEECGAGVAGGEAVNLRAEIVVTPTTTGPVVPVSAIRTTAAGRTVVLGPDGTETPVTVLASARGLAVVDGVRAGDVVTLPAEPS